MPLCPPQDSTRLKRAINRNRLLDAAGQPIVDETGNRLTQDHEDRIFALP